MGDRSQTVRPFGSDPVTGTRRTFVYDNASDTFMIVEEQNVEPVLAHNQELRKETTAKTPWKGDMHRVASIPNVVIASLMQRGIWNDEAAMKKWLNSAEAAPYRTRPGRV